jgi:hypothetical protein
MFGRWLCKNSWADENVWTSRPAERMRSFRLSRTELSSSTTNTNAFLSLMTILLWGARIPTPWRPATSYPFANREEPSLWPQAASVLRHGLYKNATAAAWSARSRASSSTCDVMNTIGIANWPTRGDAEDSVRSSLLSRTSRIKQSVSCRRLEVRNASAEEKPSARKPRDRNKLLSEFLKESSSSTIEIAEFTGSILG